MNQKKTAVRALVIAVLLTSVGCHTRSISDSGSGSGDINFLYRGELAEFDVLGIENATSVSDREIAGALEGRRTVNLPRGCRVLLVQSGAMIPDEPMLTALGSSYSVGTFSGIPQGVASRSGPGSAPAPDPGYGRGLRLAAARGGYEKVVVYWGQLETAREDMGTKAISWVPIVGWMIPDEEQRMRIRLKVALVDVRSGNWEMFLPEPFEDVSSSAHVDRTESDQSQVGSLKANAYAAAADALVRSFGG